MPLPTTVCSVCWHSLCFESGCPPSFWSERKRHGAVSACLLASTDMLEMSGQVFQTAMFLTSFVSFRRLHAGSLRDERAAQKGLRERVSVQLPQELVTHACRPQHLTEGSGVGTTSYQIGAEEGAFQVFKGLCFQVEQSCQQTPGRWTWITETLHLAICPTPCNQVGSYCVE